MSIKYTEISREEKKWGIDVRIDFRDQNRDVYVAKTIRFKDQKELDTEYNSRIIKVKQNIEDYITERDKELQYPSNLDRSYIEEILKEKGYLLPNEHFEDLKTVKKL